MAVAGQCGCGKLITNPHLCRYQLFQNNNCYPDGCNEIQWRNKLAMMFVNNPSKTILGKSDAVIIEWAFTMAELFIIQGKISAHESAVDKERLKVLNDFAEVFRNMEDIPPEFNKLIDENFWELMA